MGLKQLVVCWSPCLHKQDLTLSSMQLITQANQTIQSVLLCVAQNHPPYALCGDGQVESDWFPTNANDFFAQFIKVRKEEDFFELEEKYGQMLIEDGCELLAQVLFDLPNSLWTDACDGEWGKVNLFFVSSHKITFSCFFIHQSKRMLLQIV